MKKNDWILTASVLCYSYLFYAQTAGVNFLLFTMVLLAGLVFKDNAVLKNNKWKLAAIGSLVSALCIAYYANTLSIVANILSLSLLSALSYSPKSSVVLSLVYAFYSYITSTVYMYVDWLERRQKSITSQSKKSTKKVALFILPILITLLFFQMYRSSNPLFDELAGNINFNFISAGWIGFTLGGLLLLYGFFYHRKISILAVNDYDVPSTLSPIYETTTKWFGKEIGVSDESYSGVVLFVLLNLLLLIVNGLDINFIFNGQVLPKGMSHSEFVHQGTGMIITSIIIAIVIILYCFRGAINFYEKNNAIKLLAYAWILQNVFMLVSTALRNNLYVADYGLTYKRIGVYYYLALAAIGLITTFIKILKLKSNNYLFRINGWIFYFVLVVSCVFSWDNIITSYNIAYPKQIEKHYLIRLSDSNLPLLFKLKSSTEAKQDDTSGHHSYSGNGDDFAAENKVKYNEVLSRKLYTFMQNRDSVSWQSWYYEKKRISDDLKQLDAEHKLANLQLQNAQITSLIPLTEFKNIEELNVSSNSINANDLKHLSSLKKLVISCAGISDVSAIATLKKLEYLDVTINDIRDYTPLYKLPKLKELYVSNYIGTELCDEIQKNMPHTRVYRVMSSLDNHVQ